eukprot:TRINITY_DN16397_c0_g1_i1.p1 TRINITY_DN16397_c0_g1~~TRINITY_DN16397_c0_g1_i1.p1  ORF type:complete len:373 (+),score=120.64 TRINITY_DN16397_c0_g1_i1:122-1240(+)
MALQQLRGVVFRSASTRRLVPNPGGYVVRTHTDPSGDKPPYFNHLARENTLLLARYLQVHPANCNVVVSEDDMVDIFMDLEAPSATQAAAGLVLAQVVKAMRAVLAELVDGEDRVENVLVLTASDVDHRKQSFHMHVRLDKPLRSKRDVRVVIEKIKKKVSSAVSSWVDLQPALTGSLRVLHATKADATRPLRPVVLSELEDADLREYLESKRPATDALEMDMAMIKRFHDGGVEPYRFAAALSPPPQARSAANEAGGAPASTGAASGKSRGDPLERVRQALDSGEVAKLVDDLPVEVAEDFTGWQSVMWSLRTLAEAGDQETVYEIFDNFSRHGGSKYDASRNRRLWMSCRPGDNAAIGYFKLKKIHREHQ